MKRLLKISFNNAIFSLIPILSWFALGIILDEDIINVFSITYPIQFLYEILKNIYGTGMNIIRYKEKDDEVVKYGMIVGTIVTIIVFLMLVINVKGYLNFMNVDYDKYKIFTIYSFIQIGLEVVFAIILEKLYFEERETLANKRNIIFNVVNFILLIGTALITKDYIKIITVTLLGLGLYTLIILIKEIKKEKAKEKNKEKNKLNKIITYTIKAIKYESRSVARSILFLITYLFGYSNVITIGEEYIKAINFTSLCTDMQWDTLDAIATCAKVDIAKDKFNYKTSIKNAYKLLLILITTIIGTFVVGLNYYNINIYIGIIFISFELIDFIIEPLYELKSCYLQLTKEYRRLVTTNAIIVNIIRTGISFIKTPYCTAIGQMFSGVEQLIIINAKFNKEYKIDDDGFIRRRVEENIRKEIIE